MQHRKAMFSGSWYPAGKAECASAIERFLAEAPPPSDSVPKSPTGGIVPHAGWYFSGSLACQVIRSLKGDAPVDTVIVIGMHLPRGSERYIMKTGGWQTPFGDLEIDAAIGAELADRFVFNVETSQRFTPDNTIELQLPFIKYFYPDAKLVPMGLPPEPDSLLIAEAAVGIAQNQGKTLRVLGSTDLTHYGPNYGFTPEGRGPRALAWVRDINDRRMVDALLAMDPNRVMAEGVSRYNACCPGAAAAAIAAAKALDAASQARLIGYATSHDKSPGDSFVGYAGIIF